MNGIIVSNKMTGVVTVLLARVKIHPIYKKRLKRSKKVLAKVSEALNIGDEVEIKEIRPQSKRVRFLVTGVLKRTEVLPEVKEEKLVKEKKEKVVVVKVKKEAKDAAN